MAVRQAFECITDYMETSALDDRSYRVICLPNKLEALLVHEPGTDKASAALDVNVGNFSDKEDMPGVAHAVEHMLFMGTKKASVYCAANVECWMRRLLTPLCPSSFPKRMTSASS